MNETFDITPGYESWLSGHGLRCLDDAFAFSDGERLDKPGLESWRQRWRIAVTDERGVAHRMYLKRFDRPPLGRQLARWRGGHLGRSTAGVEWQNARALAEAGIAAAGPIAFGQRMAGPWEIRSFILLREVVGTSLERWVPTHLPALRDDHDSRGRRARCDRLARFVARFHRAGFVHRDLYLSHVFITLDEEPAATGTEGSERFSLIDLQRVFRPRWRRRRWVVKDLAALNYSTPIDRVARSERLRFLCRYVRVCDRFGSARRLAREVGAKTARMARRRTPPRAEREPSAALAGQSGNGWLES